MRLRSVTTLVAVWFWLILHNCHAQLPSYLLLKMDWLPSSCKLWVTPSCTGYQHYGVWGLEGYYPDGKPDECLTTPFSTATMGDELVSQLRCIFKSLGEETDETLWEDGWKNHGSCFSTDVNSYFQLMGDLYAEYNPNKLLYPDGKPTTKVIKGADIIQGMEEKIGKKVLIECNEDNSLQNVVVCFSPNPPYSVVDCPQINRDEGKLRSGTVCDGPLDMGEGIEAPEECQPYFTGRPVVKETTPPETIPPVTPAIATSAPEVTDTNAVNQPGQAVNSAPTTENNDNNDGTLFGGASSSGAQNSTTSSSSESSSSTTVIAGAAVGGVLVLLIFSF